MAQALFAWPLAELRKGPNSFWGDYSTILLYCLPTLNQQFANMVGSIVTFGGMGRASIHVLLVQGPRVDIPLVWPHQHSLVFIRLH